MNIWCAVVCGNQRLRNSEASGLEFICSLNSFSFLPQTCFFVTAGNHKFILLHTEQQSAIGCDLILTIGILSFGDLYSKYEFVKFVSWGSSFSGLFSLMV